MTARSTPGDPESLHGRWRRIQNRTSPPRGARGCPWKRPHAEPKSLHPFMAGRRVLVANCPPDQANTEGGRKNFTGFFGTALQSGPFSGDGVRSIFPTSFGLLGIGEQDTEERLFALEDHFVGLERALHGETVGDQPSRRTAPLASWRRNSSMFLPAVHRRRPGIILPLSV